MTKFFKTLEELKASLPNKVNLLPEGSFSFLYQTQILLNWGAAEAPQTAVIVNGNNLEKYSYICNLSVISPYFTKSASYEFKLLDSCPISNYASLVESKDAFEATLPEKYEKEFSFWSNLTGKTLKQEGEFFAPKTVIFTNGDKFQEVKYTPVKGKCLDSSWFTDAGIWEVEYSCEILNELPISEVLAEFII